jgi:hypothetical protein
LGDDVLVRPSTALDLQTLTHMTDWYFPTTCCSPTTISRILWRVSLSSI